MAGPFEDLRRAVTAEVERLGEQLRAVDEAEAALLKLRALFEVPDIVHGQQPSPSPRACRQTASLPGARECPECHESFEPPQRRGTQRSRTYCSVKCRNRANSRARGPRQRRQRKPANGGTEAAPDPALGSQRVELDVGVVLVLGEDLKVREGAAEVLASDPGDPHDSNGATIPYNGAGGEPDGAPLTGKTCLWCERPVGASRKNSAYCSGAHRELARQSRLVSGRNQAWSFALNSRLFQVLDHRTTVRLRPPDFELVKQHRARPL